MVCNLFYIQKNISFSAQQKSLLLLLFPLSERELHISKCLKNFCSFRVLLIVCTKRKRFIRIYLLFKFWGSKRDTLHEEKYQRRGRKTHESGKNAHAKIKKFSYQVARMKEKYFKRIKYYAIYKRYILCPS